MTLHKNKRLEIRLTASLKDAVEKYCADSDMDVTYFVATLLRSHLKRAGYFCAEKPRDEHRWTGSVIDMPMDVEASDRRWQKINRG